MRLRRITKHINDQNWFAVALDFFIVVVGIFIAFQITNWNESRGDARQEAQIMQSIADDLRRDRVEYQKGIDSAIITISAANYILDSAGLETFEALTLPAIPDYSVFNSSDGQVPVPPSVAMSPDQKQHLWSSIVVLYFPSANPTALDSLVSTGNLGIIQDERYLRELQTYRQFIDELAIYQRQTLTVFRTLAVETGQQYGLSPFMKMQEDEFIDLIKSNKSLAAVVSTQLAYTVFHLLIIKRADAQAAALLSDIEERESI